MARRGSRPAHSGEAEQLSRNTVTKFMPSWGLRTSARARSKPFYTGPSRRILLAGFRRALLRRLSYHEGVVCSDFADLSAAAANERFLVTSADSPTRGIRVKACPSRVPSRRPR